MRELWPEIERCQQAGKAVAIATVVQVHGSALRPTGSKRAVSATGDIAGSVSGGCVEGAVFDVAQQVLKTNRPQLVTYGIADELAWEVGLACGGQVQVFVEFHTIVLDARSAFATRERFPHADELLVKWPSAALEELKLDEASFVVVITHDDKLDVPALQVALASPARYIGVLGSRGAHAKRLQALRRAGVTGRQLARLHAPIGLEVGAVGPQEIALAILAEVVTVSHGLDARRRRRGSASPESAGASP